jgi:hypothetical protein
MGVKLGILKSTYYGTPLKTRSQVDKFTIGMVRVVLFLCSKVFEDILY